MTARAHLLFEQSGTFKRAFSAQGIPGEDYDIKNDFGETENVCDLFKAIRSASNGEPSVLDKIKPDDYVMAFFPCTWFETIQQTYYSLNHLNLRGMTLEQKVLSAIDRLRQRTDAHELLYRLWLLGHKRKWTLVIENPATPPNYLISGQNFPPPSFVDPNRQLHGDMFSKPTAYWFVGLKPGNWRDIYVKPDKTATILNTKGGCTPRSMIAQKYADAFVRDIVLGKGIKTQQTSLFD